MAPFDEGQKTEIREMIRQGTNQAQLAAEKADMFKNHEDMRMTMEEFVRGQVARNEEVETKHREITQEIETRFTSLRAELGQEFASTKKDADEVRTLVGGFEDQKRVMITKIETHFRDFETKSGEMKVLIGQLESVLQQSSCRNEPAR